MLFLLIVFISYPSYTLSTTEINLSESQDKEVIKELMGVWRFVKLSCEKNQRLSFNLKDSHKLEIESFIEFNKNVLVQSIIHKRGAFHCLIKKIIPYSLSENKVINYLKPSFVGVDCSTEESNLEENLPEFTNKLEQKIIKNLDDQAKFSQDFTVKKDRLFLIGSPVSSYFCKDLQIVKEFERI